MREGHPRAFKAGAKRVSIDFTEGRLACRNDPEKSVDRPQDACAASSTSTTGCSTGSRLRSARTSASTPAPAAIATATHSADVDYADLLPSMFKMNAGYFLIQLSSEKDKERVYKLIGQTQPGGRQRRAAGLLHRRDQSAEPAGRDAGGSLRRSADRLEIHPERTTRLDRRLRLLAVQHRRQAEAWFAGRRARHRLPEDHKSTERRRNGIAETWCRGGCIATNVAFAGANRKRDGAVSVPVSPNHNISPKAPTNLHEGKSCRNAKWPSGRGVNARFTV